MFSHNKLYNNYLLLTLQEHALLILISMPAFIEINKKPRTEADSTNWCNTLTKLLASKAMELQGDVAFAELVESLQSRGGLLAI